MAALHPSASDNSNTMDDYECHLSKEGGSGSFYSEVLVQAGLRIYEDHGEYFFKSIVGFLQFLMDPVNEDGSNYTDVVYHELAERLQGYSREIIPAAWDYVVQHVLQTFPNPVGVFESVETDERKMVVLIGEIVVSVRLYETGEVGVIDDARDLHRDVAAFFCVDFLHLRERQLDKFQYSSLEEPIRGTWRVRHMSVHGDSLMENDAILRGMTASICSKQTISNVNLRELVMCRTRALKNVVDFMHAPPYFNGSRIARRLGFR